MITPQIAVLGLTVFWLITWLIAAVWARQVVGRANFGAEFAYRAVIVVGCILLYGIRPIGGLQGPIGWAMVALAFLGFAFCWWARVHLGALWSANVVRKDDHHIVESGPYGLVRHPIYTGMLAATLALAVVDDLPQAWVGFVIITVGYIMKASLEERFLRQELGPEAYDGYRRRVPMLIPWKLGFKGG
jgi:protein-S-isoprenylcysteine O-methyltransferase Ste14